jgi:hypothetical protein
MSTTFGDALLLVVAVSLSVTLAAAAYGFIRLSTIPRRVGARPGRLRLLIGNTLVLCFLLSLVMLGAEFYLRFVYDSTDVLNQTRVSRRWFDRYWDRNNAGVRDNIDYEMKRERGRPRLTVVGDSFTAGQGVKNVEDRFVNIIRNDRPDWEVHSIARLGADTPHQILGVRELAKTGYDFDLVVLAYCWNDILSVMSDLVPFFEAMNAPRPETGAFWIDHSLAINAAYHRYRLFRETRDLGAEWTGVFEAAYQGEQWDMHEKYLTLFKQTIEEAGGRLVVVTFPRLSPLTRGEVGMPTMHDRVDELWSRLGVPHLDLLPTLRAQGSSQLVVNDRDEHPSEFTHRLAAEAILPFLDPLMLSP